MTAVSPPAARVMFGADTVTFYTTKPKTETDAWGNPDTVNTPTVVPGCRHRPNNMLRSRTDTAELWQTVAPPVPAVLAATTDNWLVCSGQTYQIMEPIRIGYDKGIPFKVHVLSRLVTGGTVGERAG